MPYLMLALIKQEYLLLTDNKHSIYFDYCIKLLSKVCNAQVGIYLTFAMKMRIRIDPVCQA